MATSKLPAPSHRRRWLLVASVVGVLLIAYALAVDWVAQRLQTDVGNSIRTLEVQDRG